MGDADRFNNGKPQMSLLPNPVLGAVYLTDCTRTVIDALMMYTVSQERSLLHSCLHDITGLMAGNSYEKLTEMAKVMEFGAAKYSRNNWRKGFNDSIPIDCAIRHILKAELLGGPDEESGASHLAHAAINVAMLIYQLERRDEGRTDSGRNDLVTLEDYDAHDNAC